MRSNREVTELVILQASLRCWKRAFVKKLAVAGTMVTCCVAVVFCASYVAYSPSVPLVEETPYATLVFAGSELGGYVLVGVIAMVVGVVLTLIAQEIAKKNRDKNQRGGDAQ